MTVAVAHSVRATARIITAATRGTTDVPLLQSDGTFALRRLYSVGSEARICIVGAMSGPHNGDRLRIEATAGAGSVVHVSTAAATIALPGPTPEHATYDVALTVEDGAELRWMPEPLISVVGSDLHQSTLIDLAPTARLILREEHILGRADEPPGRLTNRLTVRRNGTTLLDQHTAYGPGTPGWDSPAVLGDNRALGQLLIIDPAFDSHPPPVQLLGDNPDHTVGVLAPLVGPAALATATAPDTRQVRHCLNAALRHTLIAGTLPRDS